MPENDLNLLRNAAIGAGKIAMRFYQKNPTSWDKGDGQGPVSEADLEIDKIYLITYQKLGQIIVFYQKKLKIILIGILQKTFL